MIKVKQFKKLSKEQQLSEIRQLTKYCSEDLNEYLNLGIKKESQPSFGYPLISFSPIEEKSPEKQLACIKKSKWEPISKEILSCANSQKLISVAKSVESDVNHDNQFDHIMEVFRRGTKLKRRDTLANLENMYKKRLD